jgi:hypothetical protein
MSDSASNSSAPTAARTQTAEVPSLTPEQQTLLTEILQRIRQQAILSGYADPYVPIVVRHGNRRLFEAISGEAPRCNRIQPEHLVLLQAALERPETVQGTFKIFIGDEEVYRIQAGVVTTDLLGLAAQTREHETATQSNPSDPQTQAEISNAVSTESPIEQTASSIEQKSQTNGNFSEMRSTNISEASLQTSTTANSSPPEVQAVRSQSTSPTNPLQPDLDRLQTQLQQLEQRIQGLTDQLQSVQSSPARWLAQTEQNIQSWARSLGQTVKRAMAEPMIRSMEAGLRRSVKLFGEMQADGSISYDSKRDQRYVIDGNHIAVSGRDTGQSTSPIQSAAVMQTPAQLWNHYAQGIEGSPSQIAMQAVRRALSDCIPTKDVMQMLHSDPQYQRIEAQQGGQAARRYAELVVGRAGSQALPHAQAKQNSAISEQVRSISRQR